MKIRILIVCVLFLAFKNIKAEIISNNKGFETIPVSDVYKVKLSQNKSEVSPIVFMNMCNVYNENMPGSQVKDKIPLTEYKGRTISYVNTSFSGTMEVEVTISDCKKVSMGEIRILPERFGIKAFKTGDNSFKFKISKPGQYSVEVGDNGYKNGLLIFANPIETDIPKINTQWVKLENANAQNLKSIKNTKTALYFKPGIHNIGKYMVPANIKSIYLADGAWVYGTFVMNGVDKSGVKIYGRGVLSGAKLNFRESHQIEALNGANNITVSGITIADFSFFAVRLLGKNNLVDWTKIVGGWIWNCDGIAAWEGSIVRNSFIWANDDNIKIYEDNIVIEDVVCWQLSNGAIFQLNWGNMKAKNCVIRNVDIVRAEWHEDRANNGILSCRTAGGANSNFVFENIRTDNPVAFVFRLSPQGDKPHPIENFVFKNWEIKMDMSKNKKNYLEGSIPESTIKGLVFENIKINNELLTNENYMSLGRFSMKNCETPVFK